MIIGRNDDLWFQNDATVGGLGTQKQLFQDALCVATRPSEHATSTLDNSLPDAFIKTVRDSPKETLALAYVGSLPPPRACHRVGCFAQGEGGFPGGFSLAEKLTWMGGYQRDEEMTG